MDNTSDNFSHWTPEPIGHFYTRAVRPYEAPRQATIGLEKGEIRLLPHRLYEQALTGLQEFERIWILFLFHHNLSHWKPMVQPPRSLHGEKYGVFATRAPYRPNPIGLSSSRLLSIEGLTLKVEGSDLLDGTPILDIKPYIPYADAFPKAVAGWTDRVAAVRFRLEISAPLAEQIGWLSEKINLDLHEFLEKHLSYLPTDSRHKRVRRAGEEGLWILSLQTWRFLFRLFENEHRVEMIALYSGYSSSDLDHSSSDPYSDKALHRLYLNRYPSSALPDSLLRHRHQ